MNVAQYKAEISSRLSQAAPSDDFELENNQILVWGSTHLNALIATELNSKIARGEMIPNIYITKETCDTEEEDNDTGEDRVFAELENEVLVLNNGMGIIQVWDEDDNEIKKADIQSLGLFNKMRFSKPSDQNILYSHEGTKIYFPGLKPADVPFEQVNVWYVKKQDLTALSDSDEFVCSDLVLPELIEAVVATGKDELFGSQPDLENQGTDPKVPVYHQQIKSN